MLTPERLNARLQEWNDKFRKTVPPPGSPHSSPIVLYQSLFALVHDLKGSVHLAQESSVHALLDIVLATDTILHQLAYDELELPPKASLSLHVLATNLESLESLKMFLENEITAALPPPALPLALLSQPYPWEGLARARARSAARHGYVFFSCTQSLSLTALPTYDAQLGQEIGADFGIVVVRKIEADTTGPDTGNGQLNLNVVTLAAFAASTGPGAQARQGWSAL